MSTCLKASQTSIASHDRGAGEQILNAASGQPTGYVKVVMASYGRQRINKLGNVERVTCRSVRQSQQAVVRLAAGAGAQGSRRITHPG